MLSYPLPEAEVLLQDKLAAAKESLENCEEDLDYLRQQITVSSLLLGLGLSQGRHMPLRCLYRHIIIITTSLDGG